MKEVTYLGKDKERFEAIKNIAPDDIKLVFKKDDDDHKGSLERTRNVAEYEVKKSKKPVLAESSNINEEKNAVSFLFYAEPNGTKIGSTATDKVSKNKACIKGFEAIKNHM